MIPQYLSTTFYTNAYFMYFQNCKYDDVINNIKSQKILCSSDFTSYIYMSIIGYVGENLFESICI